MATEELIVSDDIQAEGSAAASSSAEPQSTESTAALAKEAPVVTEAKADEFGPLPYERHHAILDSTRRRYEDKLSGLSWADGLSASDVREALALRDRYNRAQAERDRTAEAPQPDARDERGEPFYTPQQAAKLAKFEAKQSADELRREMDERYGPIATNYEHTRQVEGLSMQIEDAKTWPGFNDNIADITAAIKTAADRGVKLSLSDAYVRVVPQKLANNRDSFLAEEKKKWAADLNNTTTRVKDDVNPGRSSAGTRKSEAEMTDAELWEHVNQPLA